MAFQVDEYGESILDFPAEGKRKIDGQIESAIKPDASEQGTSEYLHCPAGYEAIFVNCRVVAFQDSLDGLHIFV